MSFVGSLARLVPGTSRWWIRAVTIFAAAALALVFVPVWVYGYDSGWYSCGSVVNKTGAGFGGDGVAKGCELIGAYSDRIVAVGVVSTASLAAAGIAVAKRQQRGGGGPIGGAQLLAASSAIAVLLAWAWAMNNERRPPHPHADIEVTFDPTTVTNIGQHTIHVTVEQWNAPTPVVVTTCTAFPADCDLERAQWIEPIDGFFEAQVTVDVAGRGPTVAVFDEAISYYAFIGLCATEVCDKPIPARPPPQVDS